MACSWAKRSGWAAWLRREVANCACHIFLGGDRGFPTLGWTAALVCSPPDTMCGEAPGLRGSFRMRALVSCMRWTEAPGGALWPRERAPPCNEVPIHLIWSLCLTKLLLPPAAHIACAAARAVRASHLPLRLIQCLLSFQLLRSPEIAAAYDTCADPHRTAEMQQQRQQ